MKPVFLLLLSCILLSCSVTRFDLPVRTKAVAKELPPLSEDAIVTVISLYEQLPDNSQFLRKLDIGGNTVWGCPACNYDLVMEEAKLQARLNGANIVKVIQPRGRRLGVCPRITFGFFRNDDAAAMAAYQKNFEASNVSSLPPDANYAVIHFYRPTFSSASVFAFPVFHDKARIGRLGNNRTFSYQTTRFGVQRFSLANSPMVFELDVQPGEEYYLSYMPTAGLEVEIPGLRLVNNIVGREEVKMARPFIPREARASR